MGASLSVWLLVLGLICNAGLLCPMFNNRFGFEAYSFASVSV